MGKKIELSPLCIAVRRLREAYGDTQERFARRLDVAVMTVSRFETGRAEPRDPRVILNLARLAYEKSNYSPVVDMRAEETLFRGAYEDIERIKEVDRRVSELE